MERSRMTEYRRHGSKRARYAPPPSSSSSDDEQDGENIVEPPGADPAVDDPVGLEQDNNVENHQIAIIPVPAAAEGQPENPDNNFLESDSDVDSNWSDELRNPEFLNDEDEEVVQDVNDAEDDADLIVQNPYEDNVDDSGESDDEDNANNFDLDHASLARVVEFSVQRTVKECVLLDLALAVRHKSTFECIIDSFFSKNVLFGRKFFPTSKREMWKVLGRNEAGIEAYVYCHVCCSFLGKKKELGDFVVCPQPNCPGRVRKPINKASYFVTLSLRKQLQYFFSIPGIAEKLAYRETRPRHSQGAIEDIYDGNEYQNIEVDGRKLVNSNNYTMTLNLDGCRASKSGRLTIVPVFLRLNELPPNLRQKFMFLAAVYVDKKEPDMTTYLHPVVKQLKRLERQGVTWQKNNEETISKIIVPNFCVDGKACGQVLNMVSHKSHFGCTCCTYFGVSVRTTMRYPAEHPDLPPFQVRTDDTMRAQMVLSQQRKNNGQRDYVVQGHQGTTPLMGLGFLDLAKGNCFDDLHFVYECAALQHTELFLTGEIPKLDDDISIKALMALIDSRMKAIKTPSCIARKPGSCPINNRKQWHGNEWRNWLWYCSMVCLHGLFSLAQIQHLERLSYASYLLSQDIILPAHIDKAKELLQDYLRLYDNFGIEKTRRNLHGLSHASECVRRWGALWCYSTFNFESWNHCLMQLVSSPKGAIQQIVTRHLISLNIDVAINVDEQVSPDVKNQLRKILKKPRHIRAHEVENHTYVLGSSTTRPPSIAEIQSLHQLNFHPQEVNAFNKILVRSTVFTTAAYQLERKSKSDDSSVYSYTNIFGTIQDIVTFKTEDGLEECGLFVRQNEVIRGPNNRVLFPFAKHVCQVDVQGGQDLLFLKPTDIRSAVVKAPLLDMMFFIPVPNLNEID